MTTDVLKSCGMGVRLALLLALLPAGCAKSGGGPSDVRIDAGACFAQAVSAQCGDSVRRQLEAGALTCLRLQEAAGAGGTLAFTYDPATGGLTHQAGEVEVDARVGDSLELELYVLRSGVTACPEFHASRECAANPGCLLSFGPEQLRVEDSDNATLIYGGEEGRRCQPTCDPQCEQERCDGLDNDCDDAIDEEFGVGGDCTAAGRCGLGRLECSIDGGVVCDTGPGGTAYAGVAETCSGVDDDCDGLVDEVFDVNQERIGVEAFIGKASPNSAAGPMPLGAACLATGACGTGVVSCRYDGRGACCGADPGCLAADHPGSAGDEVCDGLDNDCDAATDEGLLFTDALNEVRAVGERCSSAGQCAGGIVICNPEQAAPCCSTDPTCGGEAAADDEQCDGLDNDCDGTADEGLTMTDATGVVRKLGEPCSSRGECAGGQVICQEQRRTACCSTDPACSGLGAGDELCDGLDNDCDGEVDEGFDVPEVCNGDDDDCDGDVDEGFDLQGDAAHCGACGRQCAIPGGVALCQRGECALDGCVEGRRNVDGRLDNGCEYECDAEGPDDPPDPDGIDDNCDGVDGEVENAVFVAEGGGADAFGTREDPLGSISAGLDRAQELGATMVLVGSGTYAETVTLVDGVGVHGGYNRDVGWQRDIDGQATRIRGGPTAMRAVGLRRTTRLSGLVVESSEGQAGRDPGTRGGNSVAIHAEDIPDGVLIIEDCELRSDDGADGARGAEGAAAAAGGGAGGTGGNAREGTDAGGEAGSAGASACGNTGGTGGRGGYADGFTCGSGGGGGGGAQGTGGAAGGAGGGDCGDRGADGSPGSPGGPGGDGAGGQGAGEISDGAWRGASGAPGADGQNGGGGGGAGGGWGGCCTAFCACDRDRGAGGGGGGGGGCRGRGGGGGGAGGGSFGLFLVNASPAVRRSRIASGDGGDGGAGWPGSPGSQGGGAGAGGNGDEDGGPGGTGGAGGAGGRGGHGGGGAGGVSYGVYRVGGGWQTPADVRIESGRGGDPGAAPGAPASAGAAGDFNG